MKEFKGIYLQYSGMSRSAYVIFFARMVTNMGAFIWPLLTLILSKKIGYTASQIAIISVAIGAVYIPGNIIGGKMADRFNKKKLIVIFDLISVTFFIACAFIEPGHMMTVFFVIAGLFANMEGPAFDALVAEASKPQEREKIYSLSYLGHNLGFIFGAAIGGMLFANHLSLMFVIDALTTLSSTILIVAFVKTIKSEQLMEEERNEYEEHAGESVNGLQVLKDRKPVMIQILAFILAALVYDQWAFVLPLYMGHVFGENSARLFGFLASFNGFVVIAFTPVITWLLKRLTELPKIIIGLSLYSGSYLLLRGTTFYPIFIIMMLVFTLGEIINMLGSSPYISRRVPATHRGRINSYRNIGLFVGGIGGRVLMGLLIDRYSFSTAFLGLGVVGIMAILVVAVNYRLDKRMFPKLYVSFSESAEKTALKI